MEDHYWAEEQGVLNKQTMTAFCLGCILVSIVLVATSYSYS